MPADDRDRHRAEEQEEGRHEPGPVAGRRGGRQLRELGIAAGLPDEVADDRDRDADLQQVDQ